MAEMFKHEQCGRTWSGLSRAHCSACHQTFTGLTGFDSHHRWVDHRLVCLDPADVGLELHGDLWGSPKLSEEEKARVFGGRST